MRAIFACCQKTAFFRHINHFLLSVHHHLSHMRKNMNKEIKIYQTYIFDSDLKEFDPAFVPNDWRHNPRSELREIDIFFDFFDKGRYKEADYLGVVSKKFNKKTKISGKRFIEFIQNNPGADVYFINPFPQNAYFSYNVWDQGESCHKGICDATQYLFDQAGIPIHVSELGRNKDDSLLYCNYWVGSHAFWESYIPFLRSLFNTIENEMPPEKRALFFNETEHDGGYAPLFPFIFERLFSTYLLLNPSIKHKGYKHTPEEIRNACINEQEKRIYNTFNQVIDRLDVENKQHNNIRAITNGLLSLLPHIK